MRPKLILAVVLLIVAPTGLLSLLAGWHLHEREALIDARIQAIAQSSVRAVARQVRQKLDDTLADVRTALADAMQAGGDAPQIGAVAARLSASRSLVTEVYVFMNPWGFIHPVVAGGAQSEADDSEGAEAADARGPTDALAAALRSRIASAAAWNEVIGVSAAHHAFCFVRLEERRGLYVGYRVNPTELSRMIRAALMDFSGGGIELSADKQSYSGTESQRDRGTEEQSYRGTELQSGRGTGGQSYSAAELRGDRVAAAERGRAVANTVPDGVVVSSSLSGKVRPVGVEGAELTRAVARLATDSEPQRAATLATLRLYPPLEHILISATAADVGAMRAAEELRLNLLRWGIVLLVLSVLAGVGVALREVAAEVRQARSRSDFVVGVSHDLRTPVASMKMLAESLLAGRVSSPEREKQFLGTIVRECERLHQLVERVLFFVRYGQNALAFQRRPVDAVALVCEAVHAFAARVGAGVGVQYPESGGPVGGCTFSISDALPPSAVPSCSPERERGDAAAAQTERNPVAATAPLAPQPSPLNPSPSPIVHADPTALGQVILNLLDNAWKYSREASDTRVQCSVFSVQSELCPGSQSSRPMFHGLRSMVYGLMSMVHGLWSRVHGPASPPTWVGIAVTDHGIGIAARDRKRLFRRFHRGAAALNANVSGVGLGLALCRHIVRRHGGCIEVRSREGQGSTFTAWLPGAVDLRP